MQPQHPTLLPPPSLSKQEWPRATSHGCSSVASSSWLPKEEAPPLGADPATRCRQALLQPGRFAHLPAQRRFSYRSSRDGGLAVLPAQPLLLTLLFRGACLVCL